MSIIKSGLRVQEDIKVIKSGFLIANIDSAFRVWREKPWASHVGFDDFCEYILPYTVGQYQPLEDWRKKFATGYEEQIDLRHPRLSHSAFWAATWVNPGRSGLRFVFRPSNLFLKFLCCFLPCCRNPGEGLAGSML